MIKKQKIPNKILSGEERIGELFTAEPRRTKKTDNLCELCVSVVKIDSK